MLHLDPTRSQWKSLIAPEPGQGDIVEIGKRAEARPLGSIAEARRQAAELEFLPIDPYVASVAGAVGADRVEVPKGEISVEVSIPDYYAEGVEVLMGTQNGPGAPMLVILPGVHSSGEGGHTSTFKKLALERGMNYVVLPNSLSADMLEDKPHYHPGNPRVDALWSHSLLAELKRKMPDLFESISVAGYSYGALQGANLIRFDEEAGERIVDGSLVAISPPVNLDHSMRQLDGLRELYAEGAGSIPATGLKYKSEVKKFGYQRFLESSLAERGQGSNITEIKISDKYGSRDGLQSLIETVDTQFGHNILPRNTQEYKDAGWFQRRRLRQEHDQQVEDITYKSFSESWMSKDRWLTERGLTPAQAAELYSFDNAIEAIEATPVLALASADDYILAGQDVAALRRLETTSGELEIVRVLDTGGHVGLTWNPKVQNLIADFASARLQQPSFN